MNRRSFISNCLSLAASTLFIPSLAFAKKPNPIELNEAQQQIVKRITDYLNSISSFASTFQQVSNQSGLATGRIFMRRPGFLRVEYDPPIRVLLVADGIAMNYYDEELNHLEQAPLQLSPMWFLLKKKIDLNDDVVLTGFEQSANSIRIDLVQRDAPDAGSVALLFLDKPLELRQWIITDPNKNEVRVGILDAKFGIPLDNALFKTPSKRSKKN